MPLSGQHSKGLVGHGSDQSGEEGGRGHPSGLIDQLDEGELAGPIDGDKAEQFNLGRLHLCNVDVGVADRVGLELLFGWLVAFDVGQPSDVVSLQTPMQGGSGQMRETGLQRVEAVLEQQ